MKVDPLEVESSRAESRLRGATFPDNSAAGLRHLYNTTIRAIRTPGWSKSNKKYSPSMKSI
jgi:hypothetical protein